MQCLHALDGTGPQEGCAACECLMKLARNDYANRLKHALTIHYRLLDSIDQVF
jgi:hypothetical protein